MVDNKKTAEVKPSKRWPLAILIAANLVPIYMVLWADWSVMEVVMLFWLENVIIGVFNVIKMVSCQPLSIIIWVTKIIFVPFFIVHYGMFTLGHGVFLVSLLSEGAQEPNFSPEFIPWAIMHYDLIWPGLMLVLSHGVYFVKEYLVEGGYRTEAPPILMFKPYGRVVLLHIGIFLMAFAILAMNQPLLGLLAMIVLKIIMEIVIALRPDKSVNKALNQRMMSIREFTQRLREHQTSLMRRAQQAKMAQEVSLEQVRREQTPQQPVGQEPTGKEHEQQAPEQQTNQRDE